MIERCTDYRRIKQWPDWHMVVSEDIYYLMEVKDGKDLGVWTLHKNSGFDGVLMHANLGKDCAGKDAKKSARDAFEWIFNNTEHKNIYAAIPDDKRHAQFMAVMAGMSYIYRDETKRYYMIKSSELYISSTQIGESHGR